MTTNKDREKIPKKKITFPESQEWRQGYLKGYEDAEKQVMERLRKLLFGDQEDTDD